MPANPPNRHLSAVGLETLKALEGLRLTAYQDQAGLWTIGYGHLLTRSELTSGKLYVGGGLAKWRYGLSRAQCTTLLRQDVLEAENLITCGVSLPLTQCQFDALVCFVFNVGDKAFMESTLCRRLNAGHYDEVPSQLRRWVYCAGQISSGLRNRREAEIRLWNDDEEPDRAA